MKISQAKKLLKMNPDLKGDGMRIAVKQIKDETCKAEVQKRLSE